jgi:hypothetical protein
VDEYIYSTLSHAKPLSKEYYKGEDEKLPSMKNFQLSLLFLAVRPTVITIGKKYEKENILKFCLS